MAKGQHALLPPKEVERLKQIVNSDTGTLKQRAQAVLCLHDGLNAVETAKRTKLTENQVRYLWRMFKIKGLDLFMVDPEPVKVSSATPAAPPPEPEPEVPGTVTLEALYSQYKIDLSHAEHVEKMAMALFDATTQLHRLPDSARQLLKASALLHDIAVSVDQPNHQTKGRDLIMAQPIRGFSEDEQRIIACATAFHRKKPKPDADPAYKALPDELKRPALAVAAILRVANGLDVSQTKSTLITTIENSTEEILVALDGPHAHEDADAAQKLADLWLKAFGVPIRFFFNETSNVTLTDRLLPEASPALPTTITVVKAGRAFALRTLERIDVLLRYVHNGDLSVLPSLARENARLLEAATMADVTDYKRDIAWLGEIIEAARVKAIFIERMSAATEDSDHVRKLAEPMISEARQQLVEVLRQYDAKRYQTFTTDLKFVLREDVDPNEKARLAYSLGKLLWDLLATLRTIMEFSTSVEEALSAVRRLQDHLIAYRELLGSEATQALDMLTPMESYLANIQTAQQMLALIEPAPVKKGRKTVTPEMDAASQALYNTQAELINMLAADLPAVWNVINSQQFRRGFALAIAAA
jgi:hypothetical protein